MVLNKIKTVKIELVDGSEIDISINNLPEKTLSELVNHALNVQLSEDGNSRKHVLLEWKDGWKEVITVPGDAVDLVRYYVIKRPEEVGRLVIERKDSDYPELIGISRKPREITRVSLI